MDGRLWTAVYVERGKSIRLISVRRSNHASDEDAIAIPADPDGPEDFPASVDGLKPGRMGREIRMLRNSLGLSQVEFAERYGIPVANIRQYEIGRTMPPPAVGAFLKVIAAGPERAAAVAA